MNFLAHTLFAQGDAERIAGQFCGDFVRGSELSQYPPGIQQGIRRHRRIDAFTDQHAAVKACHSVFKPPVRRFAGIITDVSFDYFLAQDWDKYSEIPLDEHVAEVHTALNEKRDLLPPALQRFSDFLQLENVLISNRSFTSVELTLERLSRRSPKFSPLLQGAAIVKANEAPISAAFDTFFPELLARERSEQK